MERITRWLERLTAAGRAWGTRAWATARDPLRVLPILAVLALTAVGLPYTVTGLSRVARASFAWSSDARVDWYRTTGTVTGVRESDGLLVRIRYRDGSGDVHTAETLVTEPTRKWLTPRVRVRFDPRHPRRVELVGFGRRGPVSALLIAGAPLGAGVGALLVAVALWRRRRLVAVSATPLAILRRPLMAGFAVLVAGVGAWATGTVLQRGWSAIASATGHLVGTVFGDLLGVFVPVVAFVLGALLTGWLARHRHHTEHEGLLSKAHGLIERAVGLVPSPEDMAPQDSPDVPTGPRR